MPVMTAMLSPYFTLAIFLATVYVYLGNVDGEVRSCSYYGRPPKAVPGERWLKTAMREAYRRCEHQNYTGPTGCCNGKPLGMTDGSIPDSSITSSMIHACYYPYYARPGVSSAWRAYPFFGYSWIQVDLGAMCSMSGLVTQGWMGHWVVEYQVVYSADGEDWRYVTDADGEPKRLPQQMEAPKKKFTANTEAEVTNQFPVAVRARFIRIKPTQCQRGDKYCDLKFEVLGCYDI